MLHQILRFKMRARAVLRAGGMDDGQRAVLVSGLQIFQQWMKTVKTIQRNRVLLGDGDARAGVVIAVILQRRDEVEPVRSAAQEDHHQRALRITVARDECLDPVHVLKLLECGDKSPLWSRGQVAAFKSEDMSAHSK